MFTGVLLLSPFFAMAQTAPPVPTDTQAIITGPGDSAIGRTVILDASSSHISGERTEYRWTIDETKQTVSRTVEAIFTPEKPGKLTFRLSIRSTGLDGTVQQSETTHEVVAYKRKIVIIADGSVDGEKLADHAAEALKVGIYVKVVQTDPSTQLLAVEDTLHKKLTDDKDALSGADSIVLWTDGIAGLQALMRSIQDSSDRTAAIHNQSIILITDRSLAIAGRTARGAVSLLQPARIIITRKEAVSPLITAPNVDDFRQIIESRDIGTLTLDASSVGIRPWDVLSILVNYLLSHGVSGQAVILLLLLPVFATIFAFLKQVVGITTFGLYTPSIIALSFLALGWWIGFLFLISIIFVGYMARSLMRRWRLLYIPKVAIILTVVSLSLLALVAIGTAFGLTFSRDTVFILLIMSTLAENFLTLKTGEGLFAASLAIGETVLGSLICVFIAQSQTLQSVILAYPELVLITIIINMFLGRWTGLRLVEYFRFREVFKHLQEEE